MGEDESLPWVEANSRVLVEFKTHMRPEILGEELVADGWEVVMLGQLVARNHKIQAGRDRG